MISGGDLVSNLVAIQFKSGGANLNSVTFTRNDTYTPTAPLDGWNSVTVNVPQSAAVTQQLNATQNQTYTPPQGVDGFNPVVVNVPTYQQEYEHLLQCSQLVVAKLQSYDPNFDPQDCTDIPPEIDKVVDENKGYEPTNGDRDDIVQAITPLGGGTIDTVANGTVGNYDYTITFAGWSDGGQMGTPITGEPINDLWDMTLYEDFTEGQFSYSAYGATYIYPVWKITVNGISGKNYGYTSNIGYLNSSYWGYSWTGYCTEEWKFGISSWNAVQPSGSGYSVNANLYVDDGAWTTQNFVTKAGVTLTNGSITNKIY